MKFLFNEEWVANIVLTQATFADCVDNGYMHSLPFYFFNDQLCSHFQGRCESDW